MGRSKTPKRRLDPDPRYKSIEVTRLVNYVMGAGKKSLAFKIVYAAFDLAEKKSGKPALELFKQACENVRPTVEVKARRVGGANLQVPLEVRPARQVQLTLRWLIEAARKRNEDTTGKRLAYELLAAAEGEGNAVKKKQSTHKAAESHKAYSHLKY